MIAMRFAAVALAAMLTASATAPAVASGYADVLDVPARMSPLASRSLLHGVTRAGARLVTVGPRGHILTSSDGGATWLQSTVPVSADLTAVHFVDENRGWAVGHDGVVLHSADGGKSWRQQLDGRRANDLLVTAMERGLAARPGSDEARRLLAEATRFREQGPDKPFLDVWFADANEGWVVGAYNLVFHTRDGGATWESWFDRTDNPKLFNLHSIRPAADGLFIAGEAGLLLKFDAAAQRFGAVPLPYDGGLFGVIGTHGAVLVFGLRGNVFRSEDGGARWSKVDAGLAASVVAATRTARGETMLADAGGRVSASDDGGRSFHPLKIANAVPLTGLAETGDGRLALTGPRGVVVTEVSAR
ncbi:MAG: glycosyl hydrolase [Burkholderiales bacterium]|jgi:photosystem II stability/assembly factor-like uncharacterized protein|nr:glycosyl hydrolase [Burkholderiales bacterium]